MGSEANAQNTQLCVRPRVGRDKRMERGILNPNASLISIRPEYAVSVLDGSKTVELRRRAPRFSEGHILVVYVTAPVMAIMGAVEVAGVESRSPSAIWRQYGKEAKVTRVDFRRYFSGRDLAVAIRLRTIRTFAMPLTLNSARDAAPTFHPPQAWVSVQTLPLPLQVQLRDLLRGA
jgi:predicted transcriptional regulator